MLTRLGAWLFRHRTAIPLPLALALLLLPATSSSITVVIAGIVLVFAGEGLRLLAVRQIGSVSRTRTDRLGPLVASGPFRRVRNPLYIGNIAIWIGLSLVAGLPWLALPIALLLWLEYHAIIRWEEQLLEACMGDAYRRYTTLVPRWLPRWRAPGMEPAAQSAPFTWRETFFSERGTLIAIAVGLFLLWAKAFLQRG
jgi:protein-S-isoprenylcysteine O-methyltransferase Ste14